MADIAIRPILAEMARQGHPFTGILYAGLMMTKDGPKVLEYNVRFGDPECEPLLMRLESDLLEIMDACIDGRLDEVKLSIRPESALGVVIAAEGYPGSYPKGMEIKGIDAVDALPDTKVFQAGTKREGSRTLSSGGRVLCVTALGKGLAEAQKRAYEAVAKIDMEKSQHRSDIGAKGLRLRIRRSHRRPLRRHPEKAGHSVPLHGDFRPPYPRTYRRTRGFAGSRGL